MGKAIKVTDELLAAIKARKAEDPALSIRALGQEFGIDHGTVSRVLSGKYQPLQTAPAPGPADPLFGRVPLDRLRLSPINERHGFSTEGQAGLVEDVARRGILQNLVVYPDPAAAGSLPDWLVAAGGRRFRALKTLAGQGRLPADVAALGVPVRHCKDESEAMVVTIVENLHREDPHFLDRADSYARLRDELGWDAKQIGRAVGRHNDHVTQHLRVHDKLLPADRERALAGDLTFTEARALVADRMPDTASDADTAATLREMVQDLLGFAPADLDRLGSRGASGEALDRLGRAIADRFGLDSGAPHMRASMAFVDLCYKVGGLIRDRAAAQVAPPPAGTPTMPPIMTVRPGTEVRQRVERIVRRLLDGGYPGDIAELAKRLGVLPTVRAVNNWLVDLPAVLPVVLYNWLVWWDENTDLPENPADEPALFAVPEVAPVLAPSPVDPGEGPKTATERTRSVVAATDDQDQVVTFRNAVFGSLWTVGRVVWAWGKPERIELSDGQGRTVVLTDPQSDLETDAVRPPEPVRTLHDVVRAWHKLMYEDEATPTVPMIANQVQAGINALLRRPDIAIDPDALFAPEALAVNPRALIDDIFEIYANPADYKGIATYWDAVTFVAGRLCKEGES